MGFSSSKQQTSFQRGFVQYPHSQHTLECPDMQDLLNTQQASDPLTRLVHMGRAPSEHAGMVNVPVYRGSTILSETLEEWDARKTVENPMASYGRFGTPLTRAFEEAVCELEGGHRS